jgi:GNAT superfamily N-acetyltransferase
LPAERTARESEPVPSSPPLEISRFVGLTGEEEAGFRRIYESSFPANQRVETDHVLSAIASGGRLAYKTGSEGALAGFGVLLELDKADAVYLEYLAVDPGRRSQGVGAALLRGIAADLLRRAQPPAGLVFEVEPVEGPPDQRAIRRRRIRFYRDNGAKTVTGAPRYVAPDMAGGGGELAFTLMWLPIATAELGGELLRRCASAILVDGYGLARDDAFVRRVLDDLTA